MESDLMQPLQNQSPIEKREKFKGMLAEGILYKLLGRTERKQDRKWPKR